MADEPALYAIGALAALSPVVKALPEEAREAIRRLQEQAHLTPPNPVEASQARPTEADRQAMLAALELTPPWELEGLARLARSSSALRPCIAAYSIMGPGFGWQLKPTIDVTSPGAADRVRKAMVADRLLRGDGAVPTDEEVEVMRSQIEREMAVEEARLTRFLNHCGIDRGLTQLRKERTQEQEGTGNAYWEVMRRRNGELAYFKPVPATTVRLRQIDTEPTMWTRRERVSPLAFEEVEIPWRFRSYVQRVHGMDTTFFSEYGDRRPRDPRTGRLYPRAEGQTVEELREALAKTGKPIANELIHWRIGDPDSPYGVPRWISAEYSVGGIQEAERVNYYYFDGRAIPPGILAVSGGKLREGAAQIIEKTLTERAAGRAAFYSMLVMEAVGAGGDGSAARCKIEWIPLTGTHSDGLFLEYQRAEGIKVQMQFRLPDIVVGRSQEVNKAQAGAAIGFTEQMVIQPLREDEDEWWNRRAFEDLGAKWHTFRTNSAVASDPEQQLDLIAKAVKDVGMIPAEGRELMGEVFNRKFDPVDAPWTKQPLPLTLAGIPPVEAPSGDAAPATGPGLANQLRAVRDNLRGEAEDGALAASAKARSQDAETLLIEMGTWKTLVDEDP